VLLDIVMPDIDGIEACAHMRSDPRYADTPIIMVTSVDDVDSLANAFVAGASD
jgi:phosphoserine phosphatase RsbU/P